MFTKNIDVKHHIKVYFLFKNSKLPSIPEEVKKDFQQENPKSFPFTKIKRLLMSVSLGEKNGLKT